MKLFFSVLFVFFNVEVSIAWAKTVFHDSAQLQNSAEFQLAETKITSRCVPSANIFCDTSGALRKRQDFYVNFPAGHTYEIYKVPRGIIYTPYGDTLTPTSNAVRIQVVPKPQSKEIVVNILTIERSALLESIAGTCTQDSASTVICHLQNDRGTVSYQDSSQFIAQPSFGFLPGNDQTSEQLACKGMKIYPTYRSRVQEPILLPEILHGFERKYKGLLRFEVSIIDNRDSLNRANESAARRNNYLAPAHSVPTLVYHSNQGRVCAGLLAEKLYAHLTEEHGRVIPLVHIRMSTADRRAQSNVVELFWEKSGIRWE